MINAIGIYEFQGNDIHGRDFVRVDMVPKDKGTFFSGNRLEGIEELLMDDELIAKTKPQKINFIFHKYEYIYLHEVQNKNIFIGISTKSPLDSSEAYYLIRNLEHIVLRKDKVKYTLDNIFMNPLGFTNTDILLGRIKAELSDVINIMRSNIEKAILRNENLDQLQDKAIRLHENSLVFKDEAKKLNTCCNW